MLKRPVVLSWAAAALLLVPAVSSAQVSVSADCSPGIPDCGSLRMFVHALGPRVGVNTLFIQMISPGWTFRSGADPSIGTYSAEDSFGPLGGFTLINSGSSIFINFLDNGFPLEVDEQQTAFIDFEATAPANTNNIWFSYSGTTDNSGAFAGTVTPEPISMILLGSGLAGIAAARRRRKGQNSQHTDSLG